MNAENPDASKLNVQPFLAPKGPNPQQLVGKCYYCRSLFNKNYFNNVKAISRYAQYC